MADLSNWVARVKLRTDYVSTVSGSARRFSVENVLELALVNAYARVGVQPQAAVALANMVIGSRSAGKKIREWNVFAAGNYSTGRMADRLDDISFDELTVDRPDEAPCFSVVRVGEVVRRVEKLFAEHVEAANVPH